MNHIYRLTWNDSQQRYVATQETARGRHKGGGARRTLRSVAVAAAATASLLAGGHAALAAPTGGQVSSGSATVQQNGAVTTVRQHSQAVALNWQSFNIGASETVNFVQPGASAVAVNRVLGSDPSAIYGKLNANGQVFLINPNGILFGRGAEVNVGALVASTLSLSDSDFAAGKRSFGNKGSASGAVTNLGSIRAADGGHIALLGAQVSNQGTLQARLGSVALAAGQQITLDFAGDKLINVAIERGALNALAENRQLIVADGGSVVLTAGAADQALSAVVNNSGLIQARTLAQHGGVISLLGDMHAGVVQVGGTLDASAPNGGDGGFVDTSGASVKVSDDARISTAAPHGRAGSWLIDPHDYTVAASGGDISGATLSANLATTNVTLQSSAGSGQGAGDVNVRDAVRWDANTTLTLTASNNFNVSAPISASGTTAGLVINPNSANGADAASGSGRFRPEAGAVIDLPNVAASSRSALVIGGVPYTVINTVGVADDSSALSLQGISGDLNGHYALGSNIDASTTATWNRNAGFDPLGNDNRPFTGSFEGLGHGIDGLTINRAGSDFIGLFGQVGASGVVRNASLNGGSVKGRDQVGPFAGWNDGSLSGLASTMTVNGNARVGGLVGANFGTIALAHASGAVAARSNEAGGLVGVNYAAIDDAYASGAVSGNSSVGGLAGSNLGTIDATYATGSTTGTSFVGGLIGLNTGLASTGYAIGSVSGSSSVGGVVGRNGGAMNALYWNKEVKASGVGAGSSAGAVGLTEAQTRVAASFAGFQFTGAAAGSGWVLVSSDGNDGSGGSGGSGGTTPMLASEYATTIANAHQLQLMALAPLASYRLDRNIDASATASGKDVWGSAGFIPVGNLATPFSGVFDGMSRTISGLTINAGASNYVGLFGNLEQAIVSNVGLAGGSITGRQYTGALAGHNNGVIRNAYATTAVSGSNFVGGLVGSNDGAIADAYASGAVSGKVLVGGLLGQNDGMVSAVYASGKVSGAAAGGLVGGNGSGTLSGAVWNSDVNAIGIGSGIDDGAVGLNTVQMQTQGNFTGATGANGMHNPAFAFESAWMSYDGHTAPLLRSFLTPLTVSANAASKTYDGHAYSDFGVSYSSAPGSALLGTLTYNGSAQGASNAGSYQIAPGGLYSTQQGYAISYAPAPLTIKPAPLSVIGSVVADKVYDGSSVASVSGGRLSGVISGDSVSLAQSGVFASRNAGSAIAVNATDVLSGLSADNYLLLQPTGLVASISPKTLTVVGTAALDKVYDGSRTATLAGGVLAGLVAGDSVLLSQSATFASKDAGSAIAVQARAGLSGANAGNYTVLAATGLVADITPKQLTVRGSANGNKVYDGLTGTTVSGGSIAGVVSGDSVALLQAGSFADKNVGQSKQLLYTNSLTGADRANYSLSTTTATTTANIVAKDLVVQDTSALDKVYDGSTVATMTAKLSGLVAGDNASLVQTGTFANKNVGVNKVVKYNNSLVGVDAGNYKLSSTSGNSTAAVTAKTVTVSDTEVIARVYNGKTKATLTGGQLVGVVGGDAIRLTQAGTFVSKNAGTVGVLVNDSLKGSAAGNYTLVQPTGLTGTITPKKVTAGAPLASKKVYDATTDVELTVGRLGGLISGDDVELEQTGRFADKNAGNSKLVAYNNTLIGEDAGNYRLAVAGGFVKAKIAALELVVEGYATAADKTYDGTTAATVSGNYIDGVLAHDKVFFAQSGKFASKQIGTQNVVYHNTLSGQDAANYTLSEKGGTTTAEITE